MMINYLTKIMKLKFAVFHQPSRPMTTLKQISMRLKSIKSIQKVTKTIKLVSAVKYANAEYELQLVHSYGERITPFFKKYCATENFECLEKDNKLIVAITSDHGLCGTLNTNVSKAILNELAVESTKCITKVVCVGDKSRVLLQRFCAEKIAVVTNEISCKPTTFLDASKVAIQLLSLDYTCGKIVFNRLKSIVAYQIAEIPLISFKTMLTAPMLQAYNSLDQSVAESYQDFTVAALIYYSFKHSVCSEQLSRMTAMDNASKNANEIYKKLTLKFNRTRQNAITRDLIEITSGAGISKSI
ncbi:ATP synthase subunit gamma, mitochondrial-like isoform X2 [Daktulosphaira vitifoliae]|uniref:ATP synthase subunit gamma, mitochondrial-like isoform X2 n=1 Tax=Daktulosphaira vitifoliae TaxID=58002 RepID=UPI0021AABA27|nr:ATP synthase subunit gamma, mitochondrial-like isoform X2 [Daktulosphaira vitifoliae]